MLYHLDDLSVLLGVVVALVGGLYAHDAVQVVVARALGDGAAAASGRLTLRLVPHLDVYGAVAAVVAGYGWGAPVPFDDRWRGRRRKVAAAALAGPVVYALLALAALGALRGGTSTVVVGPGHVIATTGFAGRFLASAAATWCGQAVLSLIPLPPMLDGGRALFAWAPVTHGWQQARFQLIERNLGMAIALAVVVLPRLFPSLPDPVGQLGGFVDSSMSIAVAKGDLLRGFCALVGL